MAKENVSFASQPGPLTETIYDFTNEENQHEDKFLTEPEFVVQLSSGSFGYKFLTCYAELEELSFAIYVFPFQVGVWATLATSLVLIMITICGVIKANIGQCSYSA